MTLVAAFKKTESWEITSDTRIEIPPIKSYRSEDSIPGICKIFVLSPTLCFGFSGERTIAFDALREIWSLKEINLCNLKSILLESHVRSECNNNYILCDLETTILKTSRSRFIGGGAKYLFVGNSKAANLLDGGSKLIDVAINMTGDEYKNVGGLHISAMNYKYGFNYISEYQSAFVTPGENNEGRLLNQSDDKITYRILCPMKRSFPVVAIYLDEAEIGFIYDHVESDEAIVIGSVALKSFRNILFEKYGFPFEAIKGNLGGFTKSDDGTYSVSMQVSSDND